MNRVLLLTVAITILIFSTATFAGGAGCDSLKGHGSKDMSVDMDQFKADHSWLFSEGHVKGESSPDQNKDLDAKDKIEKALNSKLIES